MQAEGEHESAGLSSIMNQIEKKLDSAQRKFVPKFGEKPKQDIKIAEFKTTSIAEVKGKTPSTNKATKRTSTSDADTPK